MERSQVENPSNVKTRDRKIYSSKKKKNKAEDTIRLCVKRRVQSISWNEKKRLTSVTT